MKITIESEALDTLKAMCEQLQSERDQLLSMVITLEDCLEAGHWQETKREAQQLIAKCTKEPEVM